MQAFKDPENPLLMFRMDPHPIILHTHANFFLRRLSGDADHRRDARFRKL